MAWGVSQEVWGINPLDGEITLAFSTKVKIRPKKQRKPRKNEKGWWEGSDLPLCQPTLNITPMPVCQAGPAPLGSNGSGCVA